MLSIAYQALNYCKLLNQVHRLRMSHTADECPCGTCSTALSQCLDTCHGQVQRTESTAETLGKSPIPPHNCRFHRLDIYSDMILLRKRIVIVAEAVAAATEEEKQQQEQEKEEQE
ncbi:hypothetical protein ElyMa_002688000 [Elysia marginata]|uniref:Uncharacterized protein n=1 Tax=Elysia marginata TaxID=1093978 RepID=A0AAV4HAN5_9GAST|nr:hypothetical protein ElyMa_002688000 [Elysia marginata]